MFPPSQSINLDVEAISGICGSISIACWIVVFSPQIVENFRRSSADGLSIAFLLIWLSGDVFNILGAVLQGVLPTMIILAVYYTLADVVLLGQCFYYRGFTLKDHAKKQHVKDPDNSDETTGLLRSNEESGDYNTGLEQSQSDIACTERSSSTLNEDDGADSSTLSPGKRSQIKRETSQSRNVLLSTFYNLLAITVVCCAGVVGWWLSNRTEWSQGDSGDSDDELRGETLQFNVWGQIFGYICAALYLGSRIPQLLLNYRRKSTEGISLLFFLFACIGNLTFVLSIIAYTPTCKDPGNCEPREKLSTYGRYMLINLSWLLGSAGTLFLDASVFVQFFMYRNNES